MTVDDAVARALDIGAHSSVAEHTIDITTLGARSGIPRRIEIWFHRVDGRWYLTGMPVPRSWYANLRANPRFVVHLKHDEWLARSPLVEIVFDDEQLWTDPSERSE